jgi:DNA-binding transcriptional MerR regulator
MISIGDFARLGRVSVRMLRHYDTIGLLRPEHVDPDSGYRYYRPAWVRNHGLTDTGRAREVYLECPDDTSEWITEIQVEFTR